MFLFIHRLLRLTHFYDFLLLYLASVYVYKIGVTVESHGLTIFSKLVLKNPRKNI